MHLTVLGWGARKKRQKRKAKAAATRQGAETGAGDDMLHLPDEYEAGSQPLADVAASRQDHAASDASVAQQHNPAAPDSQQKSASPHAVANDDPAPYSETEPLPQRSHTIWQASAQLLSSQTLASTQAPAAAAAAEVLGRRSTTRRDAPHSASSSIQG